MSARQGPKKLRKDRDYQR